MRFSLVGFSVATLVAAAAPAQALDIVFTDITPGGMSASALAGFNAAAARYESAFSDPITVSVDIFYGNIVPGAGNDPLGSTSSFFGTAALSSVETLLTADATTADDTTAVANLPGGTLTHLTNGAGTPPVVVTDNNANADNTTLRFTIANARALGFAVAPGTDGTISFSDEFSWDFDPTDGIGGSFDFVGVAAHEIGHLPGFTSGVDRVDYFTGAGAGAYAPEDGSAYLTVLDIYRYSVASAAVSANDSTTENVSFFSLDGGTTNLGLFSQGVANGDGRQASHWKDSLGLGLMDPTAAPGEIVGFTALDLLAFDAIGFDPVPEPGTFALYGLAALGFVGASRRRRRTARARG